MQGKNISTIRVESYDKTCPKGFGLKVAKLRLKTPLKMKGNLKGNLKGTKENAQETLEQWSQAIAKAKSSKS